MDYWLYVHRFQRLHASIGMAIDLLSATSGATDMCGAPINPQEQGDDVGLIIAVDAVTLDDDREVEVKGQSSPENSGSRCHKAVTTHALHRRMCADTHKRNALVKQGN